ncbi:uncharacterized protein LOC135929542 isoform X2 [Gordionus sp. m RMFG-2023]|uniref:uncharacterized protein LOC135929542 isoform X2 n=1 Tax=Gordionus sp. m RMFG-2023 TaxID=3053472 RepID=UPI0031FC0C51
MKVLSLLIVTLIICQFDVLAVQENTSVNSDRTPLRTLERGVADLENFISDQTLSAYTENVMETSYGGPYDPHEKYPQMKNFMDFYSPYECRVKFYKDLVRKADLLCPTKTNNSLIVNGLKVIKKRIQKAIKRKENRQKKQARPAKGRKRVNPK